MAPSRQMNGTFTNNILNNARGDVFQAANSDVSAPQAAMDVVFRNNTVSNNHPNIVIAGGGVTFSGTGAMTYDISCNKFRDSKGHGLNVFKSRPGNGQSRRHLVGDDLQQPHWRHRRW